mgnify:CR=1 FL=1
MHFQLVELDNLEEHEEGILVGGGEQVMHPDWQKNLLEIEVGAGVGNMLVQVMAHWHLESEKEVVVEAREASEWEHRGALEKHTQGAMVVMSEVAQPMVEVVGTHLTEESHTWVEIIYHSKIRMQNIY